jgi:acyl-CoA thioesterase-1
MRWFDPRVVDQVKIRTYGNSPCMIQSVVRFVLLTIVCATISLASVPIAASAPRLVKIVALGDSLTAGLGLPANEAFPAKLQRALEAKSVATEIANAGVSGDTAAGGLARLPWSVPEGTDAVILELGANDMLRGLDPKQTRASIDEIVRRLTDRGVAVLICGMRAAPNLGEDYAREFNSLFTHVAAAYQHRKVTYYPFFLDGVAADPALNQPDGLHPTAKGVDVIVAHILPKVEELLARVDPRQ